jgi:hypothetical protein
MDELLDDLENLVDDDWKQLYKQHQTDEHKRTIAEPVVPDFPNYAEFYSLLVNMIGRKGMPVEFEHLIWRITRRQDHKSGKDFENVWNMICDPSRYYKDEHRCQNCNRLFTVVTERRRIEPSSFVRTRWDEPVNISRTQTYVYCPACGADFVSTIGKLVGVFENGR